MSTLSDVGSVASICAGIVLPLGAVLIYITRKWIQDEVISKLSNDETPVAKYAHDARDYAKQAFDTSTETNRLLVNHVTNTEIHQHVSE